MSVIESINKMKFDGHRIVDYSFNTYSASGIYMGDQSMPAHIVELL